MKLTQISVFLENKEGRLFDICSLLGENAINIRALNIAETSDYGILRMVVDKPDQALGVMKENNIVATLTDVVGVEVEDRPGGLVEVLKVLRENGINVEYMYAFVRNSGDNAIMIFRFDDLEKAVQVLKDNDVQVIAGETVHQM